MNKLIELWKYGQGYWLDNLNRKMINSGELQMRVYTQGLRGITSNPTIFNKAISEGDAYDQQIKELAQKGKSPQEIYESLAVTDIQKACDILKPVYEGSGGIDGFVSLEVSPLLAHDVDNTMNETRRLFKRVGRPNCFIKIPATKEGIIAIEEMLYEGININITLLFSIERYMEVAHAYTRAFKRRTTESKPVNNIISVASFFLSRIDVLVDQLLENYIALADTESDIHNAKSLLGKTGIASAKLAYQSFKEIFNNKDWHKLQEKEAHLQRLLWASTGNKNPSYSDTRYVENLIGANTINTMPEETIKAFAALGKLRANTIEEEVEDAKSVFTSLKKTNINIATVTQQLEDEGVQKFTDSYNKLLSILERKKAEIVHAFKPNDFVEHFYD